MMLANGMVAVATDREPKFYSRLFCSSESVQRLETSDITFFT